MPRSTPPSRLAAFGLVVLLMLPGALRAADTPSAQADEPRAYGHQVGDTVRRVVRVRIPSPWRLDPASLPTQGRRGRAVELRAVDWASPGLFDDEHRLVLDYQVFLSPPAAQVLELPPLTLQFDSGERPLSLRVDAWPLAVAPLVGVEAPVRNGLGELRPLAEAPRASTEALRTRLLLWAALALFAVAWLLQVYLIAPRWAARHRPFARAWTLLRRLPDAPATAARRAAFRALHQALDRSAGEVLYAHGLDAFLARQPRYRPEEAALRDFYARSRAEFFATDGTDAAAGDRAAAGDAAWLRGFARRCRDLERGAA